MKNRRFLISSIIQLAIGLLLAIISFIVLSIYGEVTTKWIITLVLAIGFVIIGIIRIIYYKSQIKDKK